jgi:hypothetical protein
VIIGITNPNPNPNPCAAIGMSSSFVVCVALEDMYGNITIIIMLRMRQASSVDV